MHQTLGNMQTHAILAGSYVCVKQIYVLVFKNLSAEGDQIIIGVVWWELVVLVAGELVLFEWAALVDYN